MIGAEASHKEVFIPVGCVPSAAVVVGGGQVVSARGVSAWGVSAWGGVCPGGVSASVHAGIHIPPAQCMLGYTPVNRMTDRRPGKYYLTATSLGTVIIQKLLF